MRISNSVLLIIVSISGILLTLFIYLNMKESVDMDYYKTEQFISNSNNLTVLIQINKFMDKCFEINGKYYGKRLCYIIHLNSGEGVDMTRLSGINTEEYRVYAYVNSNPVNSDTLYMYYLNNGTKNILLYDNMVD